MSKAGKKRKFRYRAIFDFPDVYMEELDQSQEFYKNSMKQVLALLLRKIGLAIQLPKGWYPD